MCYDLLKVIFAVILLAIIIITIFYILQTLELEQISTKSDIDTLYNNINYGDILILRLSSLQGRIAMTPIATFFHYVMIVQLPGDNNKYVFHTRNRGIRKVLYPELKHNVETLGINETYQLVELKNYLNYIKNRQEYFTHLKTHNHYTYYLKMDDVNNLNIWKSYITGHCGVLTMQLMERNKWTKQNMYPDFNRTYYSPICIQDRLIKYDNYTYEGIFSPRDNGLMVC